MTECKFARKAKDGAFYEYGYWQITDIGTKSEKRIAIVTGTAPSLDEALTLNTMSLNGSKRIGVNPSDLIWKDTK